MYKITFKARGANALNAIKRLKTIGLAPDLFCGVITLESEEYKNVYSLVKDLAILDWDVQPIN